MGAMSQEEINISLFEEVSRLKEELEKYKKAVTLALVTLEDNNLMNDKYYQIHAILDDE